MCDSFRWWVNSVSRTSNQDYYVELIRELIDFFLHLDEHLSQLISRYGTGTHLILFLIVFCETGLVITPFLPGDSLLFAAGTFAALGALDLRLLIVLLTIAAIVGDTVNYWVGSYVGPRAFSGNVRFLKKEYLDRTHAFYEKHGGKTIILARFIPIIRTFAPFVAGVGAMSYPKFLTYNVIGAVVWVVLFVLGGYFFGNIPTVRQNFTLVILAIIAISVLPIVIEAVRSRRSRPA
jgi:membrane-associated protein